MHELTEKEQKHRADVIEGFRRFAAWLEAHPNVPAPYRTIASYILQPTTIEQERIDALHMLDLADRMGAEAYENSDVVQADLDVSTFADGAWITYRGTVIKIKGDVSRYVAQRMISPHDTDLRAEGGHDA